MSFSDGAFKLGDASPVPVSVGTVGIFGGTTRSLVGIVPFTRLLVVDALKPARESRPPRGPDGDWGVFQVELLCGFQVEGRGLRCLRCLQLEAKHPRPWVS